eukprot:5650265-Pleurochrysis_carterae.AAC.1
MHGEPVWSLAPVSSVGQDWFLRRCVRGALKDKLCAAGGQRSHAEPSHNANSIARRLELRRKGGATEEGRSSARAREWPRGC